MIRNIWKESNGVGRQIFQFRMVSYGTGTVIIFLHHLETGFPITALEYSIMAAMVVMPRVFLYRFVKSGLSPARVIKDTGHDFFFAGLFAGAINLSIVPSFVFALGALTNYLAVRGFHKLYRALRWALGCLPILWLDNFQFHFDCSNLILLISLSYCVVHYVLNAYILYYSFNTLRLQHDEIEKQRAEILEKSEELVVLNDSLKNANVRLEEKVTERTRELEIKNKKLEEYTFINAHKLRAPVATILGLIQLYNYKDILEGERIMEGLKKTAIELDQAIKSIREKLEEEGWLQDGGKEGK